MLHIMKIGKSVEKFLEKCTIRIPCNRCHGIGCANCSGFGYTREIINSKMIIEV